jgi:membrane associated rhomboid family serine protease
MMPITPIVKHLLIINAIFFIAIHLMPEHIAEMMPFYSPATGQFQPFQIITYMFTHFDVSHIFFNMLSLYFIGPAVEMTLGPKRFFGLYMISGLMGLAAHFLVFYLPYLLGQTDVMPLFSVLGASGAVFGVLIAFATLYPDRQLMLLFPPIPIKAWVMALILVGIGLYQGLTGTGGNIAHFAHLGGALAGFLLARHWKHGGRFLR